MLCVAEKVHVVAANCLNMLYLLGRVQASLSKKLASTRFKFVNRVLNFTLTANLFDLSFENGTFNSLDIQQEAKQLFNSLLLVND